ncbi:hypothetical protein L1987_50291 [Smallanthus sonchifolius]|uniref:Uncharacterized protein n=1 Tax=Smallanthus sonchifolius TaxID=185202 RepID=A0ACB9EMJ7_9ASTR|nr:hypothetical protein L1987_50291 [Smallanthus sonchifolius]
MEDSMINMPDLVFDEKVGNKRVRDGEEEEIHKGRLEKRPSGILGVTDGGDYTGDQGGGGGIIDTFISNVFHKNRSGTEDEVEVGGEVKIGVFDVVEDEDKRDDLGGDDGGDGGGEGGEGGGGIISAFFSNIFHQKGSADDDGDQAKSDHLGGGPGGVGENGGGGDGEPEDLSAEKLEEKKDKVVDLPSKDSTACGKRLTRKPDRNSNRNNNNLLPQSPTSSRNPFVPNAGTIPPGGGSATTALLLSLLPEASPSPAMASVETLIPTPMKAAA